MSHPAPETVIVDADALFVADNTAHGSEVHDVSFSPDGTLVVTAGCADRTVRVIQVPSMRQLHAFETGSYVWGTDYHPTRRDMAAAALGFPGYSVLLVDPVSRTRHAELKGHTSYVNSVRFCPAASDVLVSVSSDKSLRLWSVQDRDMLSMVVPPRANALWRVEWSPDCSRVATCCGGGFVHVVDVDLGEREFAAFSSLKVGPDASNRVYDVEWSEDGQRLFTAQSAQVTVVDAADTSNLATLAAITHPQHFMSVKTVPYSPHLLVFTTEACSILLYSLASGSFQKEIKTKHTTTCSRVVLSPTQEYMATTGTDSRVSLMRMVPEMSSRMSFEQLLLATASPDSDVAKHLCSSPIFERMCLGIVYSFMSGAGVKYS